MASGEQNNEEEWAYPRNYEEECQLVCYEFDEWRRGGINPHWNDEEIHQFRSGWRNRKLPRPGQPLYWGGNLERYPWQPDRPPKYYIGSNVSPPDVQDPWSATDPRVENVKKRYRDATEYFEQYTHKFQFQKLLGFGGLGLALHYKQYEDGVAKKDVAVKLSLNSWVADDIRWEERATRAMEGAAHSIQLIHPPSVGLPEHTRYRPLPDDVDSSDNESSGDESVDEGYVRPPRKPRNELTEEDLNRKRFRRNMNEIDWRFRDMTVSTIRQGDRKDYMILEYLEGGTLEHLIGKLQERRKEEGSQIRIPGKVLWALWLCLIRACIGLKYPPRKFHPRRRRLGVPFGRTDLIEMIPPENKRWRAKNWVHFDIDPSNILIGNMEAPPTLIEPVGYERRRPDQAQPDRFPGEHIFVPRLKLADFGLAEQMKMHKRNVYYHKRRKCGKQRYYAPEQFGVEWERIPPNPDGAEVSEQNIIGNYGSAMNVYQIALTLWTVITQLEPPTPVAPQPPLGMHVDRDENELIPGYLDHFILPEDRISYCPFFMDHGNPYEYIDIELRTAIYECMYHRQEDRPTLETLLEQARLGSQREVEGESGIVVREWINQFFLNG
ncbi:kinase-like protein [Annulohypoxylon moriforme]|nr:kinase-like protein [Annulohypoxylon moriforme]